jgi:predicted RNase H-like HicB family nuclease
VVSVISVANKLLFKYETIIYWSEEDGLFVAEVPELPGCMADGATQEEAIRNAEGVISEWIETAKSLGREIPAPQGTACLCMS